MSGLFRFPTSVERDPAIEVWMDDHPGEPGTIARHWFEVMQSSRERRFLSRHSASGALALQLPNHGHVSIGVIRVTRG